jgi:hypothetical protein
LALRSAFLPFGLSTVTLSALTMERYIAILHPFAYNIYSCDKKEAIDIRGYRCCGDVFSSGNFLSSQLEDCYKHL